MDLVFSDEGNPSMTSDGRINFEKDALMCTRIQELERYKDSKYDFIAVEPLFSYLSELPALEENDLYKLSLERQPRQSSAQPERKLESRHSRMSIIKKSSS